MNILTDEEIKKVHDADLYLDFHDIARAIEAAVLSKLTEACAKVCEAVRAEDGDGQHPAWYAGIDMCIDAIRNGEWGEYL